ncbi:carboxylesterase/lipase family protein [Pedobacter agri]|uniref:carboxylesterase/lipase family protein n=1 Tax=Pedobacter agri TaxID=454586 RepID=UPI0029312A20|nr:carboxylesterase family protein [Pedobacter agri]
MSLLIFVTLMNISAKHDYILKVSIIILILFNIFSNKSYAQLQKSSVVYATVNEGRLEGKIQNDVFVFKGVPYAAPPIGPLRWKAPQPLTKWSGVRKAIEFSARPVQKSGILYEFRSENMSEDCLYLNIWSTAKPNEKPHPVYVFIHGGSFIHGDGSQPAYDGESMAKKGIVYISINYRLGVFGFLAHPDLAKENQFGASGNYGLLDQVAALKWIRENIAAFGGDPNRITIGGESVGAQSVSAHMASPLSKGLFSAAIAQSSSLLDSRRLIKSKESSEKMGIDFVALTKSESIAEMRAIDEKRLLKIASKGDPRRFKPTVDGYFLPKFPTEVFEAGEQIKVPLLVGWNADEVPSLAFYRLKRATPENFYKRVRKIYGEDAAEVLKYYPVTTKEQAKIAGAKLGSDWLINFGTWRLAELHAKSNAPVYRYLFDQPHPGLTARTINDGNFFQVLLKKMINKAITGSAFHAAEIEYALGNLDVQRNYAWKQEDYKVSQQMQAYFSNFIHNNNPNLGSKEINLINWPKQKAGVKQEYLRIGLPSKVEVELDTTRNRYLLLQRIKFAE